MQLARIDGVVITTVCHPSLVGYRSVICQPIDGAGDDQGPPVIAIDPHGAALHSRVFYTTDGSSLRALLGDPHSPLRNMVCAIVDPAATR
ncbi:MAG: EutN/CcmL family microcompartment protein [Opitutaceae bacterium]|nr:EutN/CcmL family microcompartment protein [Opitutaceae bacterium]